jgi:hypothetical protein
MAALAAIPIRLQPSRFSTLCATAKSASIMRKERDFADWLKNTGFIIRALHGHNERTVINNVCCPFEVNNTKAVNRYSLYGIALVHKLKTWFKHRLVLNGTNYNLSPMATALCHTEKGKVVRFSRTACKKHRSAVCTNRTGNFLPRLGNCR